jgi:hypothetical protein
LVLLCRQLLYLLTQGGHLGVEWGHVLVYELRPHAPLVRQGAVLVFVLALFGHALVFALLCCAHLGEGLVI